MPGPRIRRSDIVDIRGASRLAIEATAGLVEIVERMHRTIQRPSWLIGRPPQAAPKGVYRLVGDCVKLVGRASDLSLAPLSGVAPAADRSPRREAIVAALNGVYGDYLAAAANPLATEMSLRYRGRPVDLTNPSKAFAQPGDPAVTGKLLVLIHGLCMNDLQWLRKGHDHGSALARDLGYTPLYLRYNSGLHVAQNGRGLDKMLEKLVAHWPVPIRDLTLIGHSMGGLVARSACHHARRRSWPKHLRKMVFLGTPHLGAPLERGGRGLDFLLELSPYSAPLATIGTRRSAGIGDLCRGSITSGRHREIALPVGVRCYAAAAMLGARRGIVAGRLVGDGLVPLDSALGRHAGSARSLPIMLRDTWVGSQMGHLALLYRAEVYTRLRSWLLTHH